MNSDDARTSNKDENEQQLETKTRNRYKARGARERSLEREHEHEHQGQKVRTRMMSAGRDARTIEEQGWSGMSEVQADTFIIDAAGACGMLSSVWVVVPADIEIYRRG